MLVLSTVTLLSLRAQKAPGSRAPDDEPLTPRQFMGMGGSNFDDALYESSLLEADADNEVRGGTAVLYSTRST